MTNNSTRLDKMKQQFDNTNTGVLFRNKDKDTDRHPDYRGTLDVNGETFWISGWIKVAGPQAKNPGEKFMSLAITPQRQSNSSAPLDDSDTDDIPF